MEKYQFLPRLQRGLPVIYIVDEVHHAGQCLRKAVKPKKAPKKMDSESPVVNHAMQDKVLNAVLWFSLLAIVATLALIISEPYRGADPASTRLWVRGICVPLLAAFVVVARSVFPLHKRKG